MSGPAQRADVAVVGGGPAGIAAALAAAREGARTVLVERDARVGGNVAHALVHTICGLYEGDRERARGVHEGLPSALACALARAGGAGAPERAGRVHYLPIRPAAFAALAERLLGAAAPLAVRTRTALRAARLPGSEAPGEPALLELTGPEGPTRLEAAAVVDTSGEAAVARRAGAPTAMAPRARLQRPSLIFRLEGVDGDFTGHTRLRLTASVARAARRGRLAAACESVVVRPATPGPAGSLYATLTLPLEPLAPAGDPEAAAADEGAEAPDLLDPEAFGERGRAHAEAVVAFLRETRPEFVRARVAEWPARLGVRETRRLVGREVIGAEDLLRGRRREDEVARSAWPIELWEDHRRARFLHPEAPASVPLGALIAREHPGLAAAGRCLSASHEALGALRVIGTALATGEAAGTAAALAADAGSALADVAPEAVRRRIRAHAARGLEAAR